MLLFVFVFVVVIKAVLHSLLLKDLGRKNVDCAMRLFQEHVAVSWELAGKPSSSKMTDHQTLNWPIVT